MTRKKLMTPASDEELIAMVERRTQWFHRLTFRQVEMLLEVAIDPSGEGLIIDPEELRDPALLLHASPMVKAHWLKTMQLRDFGLITIERNRAIITMLGLQVLHDLLPKWWTANIDRFHGNPPD